MSTSEGLAAATGTADNTTVTLTTIAGLLPAALRPVVLEDVPEGWERQAHHPSQDGEALAWLGFEAGDPDEPLLDWPQPDGWPADPQISLRLRLPVRLRTA